MKPQDEALKDCEFCGATDEGFHLQAVQSHDLQGNPKDWAVECDQCAAYGPTAPTKELAHALWNTRLSHSTPGDAEVRKALEKCRDQFDHYAGLHIAKNPPDKGKAVANMEFADMCRKALATPSGRAQGEWRPIETAPKKGTPFLAAIHHGQFGYIVVEASRRGNGVHHVAEDSCIGWHPGCRNPAYWQPLPAAPPAQDQKGEESR